MHPHIREKYVLYFQDEMRYGLLSNVRRSWSKVDARAILPHQHAFENRYLFSAVAPLTGDSFHIMSIDGMDSIAMNVFLTELKRQHPNEHVFVVVDNAPCHKPKWVRDIEGLTVIFLPPYSPELNPAERYFEEMRRGTANRVFEKLEDIEKVIEAEVKRWSDDTEAMKRLVGHEWIREQCREVC